MFSNSCLSIFIKQTLPFLFVSIGNLFVCHKGKIQICDTIKGNESLVENLNSYFLAPHSHNFIVFHSDPNPVTIGYLVTEL